MGVTERTSRAILDAAISTWARDSGASLGAIAKSAGVGRTTLHRFHPDRAALIEALDGEVRQRFAAATLRADIETGSALTALHRLCVEYLSLGDALRLVFVDNSVVDPGTWDSGPGSHARLCALFGRGQDAGQFDSRLDPEWMVMTMWLLLYGVWLVMSEVDLPLADAAGLLMRTLTGAVGAKPAGFPFAPP